MSSYRPVIMGTRHAVAAGHYLAAEAGFDVLNAGGNAIDAGVAAGLAIGVLQCDIVNVAGVAPIILWIAEEQKVVNIDGGLAMGSRAIRHPVVRGCRAVCDPVRAGWLSHVSAIAGEHRH